MGEGARYRRYGSWLKSRFGVRVHKVTVDGGFTCPNRDGTVARGGCSYCSNESFRTAGAAPRKTIEAQILDGIRFLERRYGADRFLVYWQHYTNTHGKPVVLEQLYRRSLSVDSRILGLCIGTRPDCLPEETLQMVRQVGRDRYVCLELGLESIFDRTLECLNRGHDVACYRDAVVRAKRYGFDTCSHVILGLPGEEREEWMQYPSVLNELGVDFVKLHHLHLVKGTRLAEDYARRPFPLFSLEGWIQLVCDVLENLEPRIVIQRLFGWTYEEFLVAPKWSASRAEIQSMVQRELERRDSWQGKALGRSRQENS